MDAPSHLRELAAVLQRHAPRDGQFDTAIDGVCAMRASAPGAHDHGTQRPTLCVVAQGAKEVLLGDEVYRYDPARYLVFSVELPVRSQVVEASRQAPYLCLALQLDPGEIAALLASQPALQARAPAAAPAGRERGVYVSELDPPLLDAVTRLARLLDTPADAPAIAPLAVREILYRLLRGEQGDRLRQLARDDSHAARVARAIGWLKAHYTEPLRVERLAREAHMSVSSLHRHFRAVTAMSPLQYQKQLRLLEARRLMLSTAADAASAAYQVGYESPSQFSREYSRLFGAPPARDLQRLRAAPAGAAMAQEP